MAKGNYKNDKPDGYWKWYHQNGKVWYKGNSINGIQMGYWEGYNEEGELTRKQYYIS
jgi:antitoxin component YwqK of YwqJK toxin-antitoxin module